MNYLVASSLEIRFIYEAKIQLQNFRRVGIDLKRVYYVFLLVGSEKYYKPKFDSLKEEFPEVNFRLFHDFRDEQYRDEYPSGCRLHVLRQFFDSDSSLLEKTFCYMDSDVLFREKLDEVTLSMANVWYGSDTYSYTSPAYIMEKGGPYMLADMAAICKVEYVKLAELGKDEIVGAQYIIKEVDGKFWNDVEIAAYELHRYMDSTIDYFKKMALDTFNKDLPDKKKKTMENFDYNPIQKFCADMWALHWVALSRGKTCKVHPELNMVMATDEYKKLDKVKIYHNNGIVDDPKQRFNITNSFWKHKAWREGTSPYQINWDHVDSNGASFFYLQALRDYMETADKKYLEPLEKKEAAAVAE